MLDRSHEDDRIHHDDDRNLCRDDAVFHRDPRELRGLGNNGWSKQYGIQHENHGPLLRQLAWEIMLAEPLSGLKTP